MTSEFLEHDVDAEKMQANIEKMEALTKRMVAAMTAKRDINPALEAPGQDLFVKAAAAFAQDVMANPAKLIERQVGYWTQSLQNLSGHAQQAPARDRRFSNPLWDTHPFFRMVRDQYRLNAQMLQTIVADAPGLDARDRGRLDQAQKLSGQSSATVFEAQSWSAVACPPVASSR